MVYEFPQKYVFEHNYIENLETLPIQWCSSTYQAFDSLDKKTSMLLNYANISFLSQLDLASSRYDFRELNLLTIFIDNQSQNSVEKIQLSQDLITQMIDQVERKNITVIAFYKYHILSKKLHPTFINNLINLIDQKSDFNIDIYESNSSGYRFYILSPKIACGDETDQLVMLNDKSLAITDSESEFFKKLYDKCSKIIDFKDSLFDEIVVHTPLEGVDKYSISATKYQLVRLNKKSLAIVHSKHKFSEIGELVDLIPLDEVQIQDVDSCFDLQ